MADTAWRAPAPRYIHARDLEMISSGDALALLYHACDARALL